MKRLKIICIADRPRGVERGVWASEHEVVYCWWLMVEDSEQNIKDSELGEGTVDVALSSAPFRIEGEVAGDL